MKLKSLLGVLGGMGPEATVYFLEKLVDKTDARTDQEHIPIVIFNNPRVPDRTLAYLGKGESPLPALLYGIKKLEDSGADLIAIPCNSAHLWLTEMRKNTNAEILSMVDIAVKRIRAGYKIGIIGTTLTVLSKLYESPLRDKGVEVLLPKDQEKVMKQIRLIKAGNIEKASLKLTKIANELIERGATHILAGCTEVPLALKKDDLSVPIIDPMEVTAEECILRTGGRIRRE
ncbi:MAG: amino acid racemase [Thermoplasmatales archaeon]|jgi:aspartate racemase|nr:amino acid racemase [Thermoplasmatales archaeon]